MFCVDKPLKCARPHEVRWESGLGDLLWRNAQTGKAIQMQRNLSSKDDRESNKDK
jgi:hypothetical protein